MLKKLKERFNYAMLLQQLRMPRNYILLFFAVIYCLISVVNHYNYRTYAFDLGIYNNCLYQYGHFHKNHYPYLHYMFNDFLADHFSLYTIILSPLHYVFGTATLLYVQILSVLIGSIGVYKLIQKKSDIPFLPELSMIHFLAFFGIYSALAFDYHDNVVSAMLLPWFFYYFETGKTKQVLLFTFLIIIGKENMPIWLCFVGVGLFFLFLKDRAKRNLSLLITFISFVYTILVFKVFMPYFDTNAASAGYHGFKYAVLGSNLSEVVQNLIHHPSKIIEALYVSHLPGPELENIKKELYICLLYSGAWILIIRPQFLIMLVPVIAQKVFCNDFQKWGISAHYSIEFVPIVVIGFYYCLLLVRKKYLVQAVAVMVCISTIYITLDKLEVRDSIYYNKTNGSFLLKEHYTCKFNKRELKRVIRLIPANAKLSCINLIAAHVSFREHIYQYPDVHDAEYILLASSDDSFPLRGAELEMTINQLKQSNEWATVSAKKGIYLFKKRIAN